MSDDSYKQLCKLKEQYHEICGQAVPLKARLREIETQEIELYKERMRVNVGRCFLADTFTNPQKYGFVKILDVPQSDKSRMSGESFNRYQYPVLYIPSVIHGEAVSEWLYESADPVVPFEIDTMYSCSADAEDPYACLSSEYQEIAPEKFEARFNQVVAEMRWNMGFMYEGNEVHSRWIPVDDNKDAFDCMACGAMVQYKTKHCPGCGAIMDLPDPTYMFENGEPV